ncbi:hypothetical protein K5L24_24310 [Klebsiella pneumoniae]|uniref:hypothetical protein n=1 Tax=Bacteria TaxID=2 RepID=UPI001E4848AC|nr:MULTISPECIES: hypothetical protein [Bacteria]MCD1495349.1 hypothetical protein [Klebsiella pneumoniae]DAF80154.1 MAG TPA: hypothetical protein [Caudoviricetes sp.]
MKEFMKTIAVLSLVGAGAYLSDDTITSFISSGLILVGGYMGGYLDGYKKGREDGKRYMLGE